MIMINGKRKLIHPDRIDLGPSPAHHTTDTPALCE
jgi:hypothetical protein